MEYIIMKLTFIKCVSIEVLQRNAIMSNSHRYVSGGSLLQ